MATALVSHEYSMLFWLFLSLSLLHCCCRRRRRRLYVCMCDAETTCVYRNNSDGWRASTKSTQKRMQNKRTRYESREEMDCQSALVWGKRLEMICAKCQIDVCRHHVDHTFDSRIDAETISIIINCNRQWWLAMGHRTKEHTSIQQKCCAELKSTMTWMNAISIFFFSSVAWCAEMARKKLLLCRTKLD